MIPRRITIASLVLLGSIEPGCHRSTWVPEPPLDPALVDRCRAGDAEACETALESGQADELVDEEIQLCESGATDRCERAGRWILAHTRHKYMARAIFLLGCADGHAGSCAGYVDFLFDGHHYLWACLDDTADAPSWFQAQEPKALPLLLTAAGPSTPLRLEVGEVRPERAALRECLDEALGHTRLPALAGEHVTSFEYTPPESSWIEPHRQTDLSYTLAWDGSLASCPAGASSSCVVLDPPLLRPIYAPAPTLEENFGVLPTAPYALEPSFGVCVDVRGRIESVEILDDAGEPAVAEVWSETIQRWRVKPAFVDDHHVPSCARLRVQLEWSWDGEGPWRDPWRPIIKY